MWLRVLWSYAILRTSTYYQSLHTNKDTQTGQAVWGQLGEATPRPPGNPEGQRQAASRYVFLSFHPKLQLNYYSTLSVNPIKCLKLERIWNNLTFK